MAYEYESELEALPELEDELEGELEGEFEEEMEDEAGLEGEGWLGAIGNVVGSLLGEGEGEEEYESEFESERELNPMRKIYPDAAMEHLGELAFEAESEEEAAEQFLPLIGMAASKLLPVVARAVAPMAKKALPHMARAVAKASPHLTRGVGQVAKTLFRNPQTRHLVKAVPAIARRTVGSVARQAAHGRRITPRTAVRTLAQQTRRVLGHPGHRKHALRQHHRLERGFHRRYGRTMARPHARYGWGRGRRYGQAPSGAAPHYAARGTVPGAAPGVPTGVSYSGVGGVAPGGSVAPGRAVGGCNCGAAGAQPTPSYCRCCGQVLR